MNSTRSTVNPIWLKAAIIGSLWASIEIILGSFLHNLRVPVTGPILASIGVSILVLTNRIWPEKGLILRAGIICAIMKSISPSAIIIGPMVGILLESLILEIIISLFGRNFFAYILGGALAVSSTLIQHIANLIITYGFNLIDLYIKIVNIADRILGTDKIGPWDIIIVLLVVELLLGSFAAIIGFYTGRRISLIPKSAINQINQDIFKPILLADISAHDFSIKWLIFHILYVIISLLILNISSILLSSIIVICYLFICVLRYHKYLNRLKKFRLWIEFGIIMLLAGFLMGGIQSQETFWNWNGFRIGFEMTLRAALMIVGFSVISVELRNPLFMNFLFKKGMGQLYSSLEVAFETLPTMMANLTHQKQIFRKPIITIGQLINTANEIYENHIINQKRQQPLYIITGWPGSGKTTLLKKIIETLKNQNIKVGGILAPGFWKDGKRVGFDIIDVQSGERTILSKIDNCKSKVREGQFYFLESGLELGRKALDLNHLHKADFIIIDEVGNLELKGQGWAPNLDSLSDGVDKPMLWVVRRSLIEKVSQQWKLQPEAIWEVQDANLEEIISNIKKNINGLE